MQKIIFSLCLFVATSLTTQAQTKTGIISFKLKNNRLLPSKVTLVSYQPNETGNGTTGFMMGPYGTKDFQFTAGTKLYLANSQQVNTVMSGAKISNQKPFMVIKKEDEGKIFNIK